MRPPGAATSWGLKCAEVLWGVSFAVVLCLDRPQGGSMEGVGQGAGVAAPPHGAVPVLERVLGHGGPGALLRLRHPHDRHPRVGGLHGRRLVLLVGHHDGHLLHPLRPDDRRARRRLAGGGRRLRLGARGLRARAGARLCAWLYWINNAYWIPSVYLIFAGHVRDHLPEDPARPGRRRGIAILAHLADRRHRRRAPRGLQVAAEPRRRGQGPHLPRPRRAGARVPLLRPSTRQRLLARKLPPELERLARVPAGPPLQHVRLRAHELGGRARCAIRSATFRA